jgi:hypothetical protein
MRYERRERAREVVAASWRMARADMVVAGWKKRKFWIERKHGPVFAEQGNST